MNHFDLSTELFGMAMIVSLLVLAFKDRVLVKSLIILIVFSASISSYRHFNSFYGYPTTLVDDLGKVDILKHLTVKEEKVIYLWVLDENEVPRAYKIPFKKKTDEYLKEKAKQAQKGDKTGGGRGFVSDVSANSEGLQPLQNVPENAEIGLSDGYVGKQPERNVPRRVKKRRIDVYE